MLHVDFRHVMTNLGEKLTDEEVSYLFKTTPVPNIKSAIWVSIILSQKIRLIYSACEEFVTSNKTSTVLDRMVAKYEYSKNQHQFTIEVANL